MRDIEIRVGDTITHRPGGRNSTAIFVEDIDYGRSSPTAWIVRGPRIAKNGHVWEKDLNRKDSDYRWFHIHPSLITSLGEGVLREVDDDTGLLIEWSQTDQAYAVKQGEHRYVAMATTFAEAREVVRSYA